MDYADMSLIVTCPNCGKSCGSDATCDLLVEGATTEGFEAQCNNCGCAFTFDVYCDVSNKEINHA